MEAQRIASLDGARAFSIILVLIHHLAHPGKTLPYWEQVMQIDVGNYGVRVFFVISGFLITTLLLNEHARTGAISLRDFYIRRAVRILPAYWFFLVITTALGLAGLWVVKLEQLPIVGLFVTNYFPVTWQWTHFWSLAVEEQFYLLWPGILGLVGLGFGLRAALAMLLISPIARLAINTGVWPTDIAFSFEAAADALATGCLLAMCRDQLMRIKLYAWLVNSPALLPLAIAVLLVTRVTVHDTLAFQLVKVPLYNVLIAMVLDRYMRHPETLVGSVLNWKPVVWVGLISYSLYIWQQFVIVTIEITWWQQVAASFACAAFSYYVVEQPCLKLRKRLQRRRTRASREGLGAH